MNQLKWRKGEEEDADRFATGETMLVVVRRELGTMEFAVVSQCQAGHVGLSVDDGASLWSWGWGDVAFWLPIAELEATLPKPTEAP